MRIARSISQNELIISVSGSWHGSTNELLYTSDKNYNSVALSSGLDKDLIKKVKFIPYNNIEISKKILDKLKKKIMCIIIEPIQGCLPLDAKNYLKFLDEYCNKNNLILIFDEMITGLRYKCSTVQDEFKLNPSISTFGKCLGGGMPIGIIGIKANIAKKLNSSGKKVFFGGTFSGNSINMYVANKTVKYLINNKKKIFHSLNKKSIFLQNSLNNFFGENNLDAKCYKFSSMLRIVFSKKILKNRLQRDFFEKNNQSLINKFKAYLFDKNIYLSSSGIIFLATTTTEKDIKYLINTIRQAFRFLYRVKKK